jgi:superfamily II DNA or RNA helicase
MIKINIENVKSNLEGDLDPKVISALYNKLAAEVQGSFYARKSSPWWDGKKHFFTKVGKAFMTGLIWMVRDVLDKHHVHYEYNDLRVKPKLKKELSLHNVALRLYQQSIVDEAVKKERGIIRVSTGGGKTTIIASLVGKLNLTTLILIHRQEIMQQIKETLERILQVPIGTVGAGVVNIQNITIAMVQSAHELKDFLPTVDVLIGDEGHHAPAETYWQVAEACPNAYFRYLFTGSDWREDNMNIMLDGFAAKKFVDINASKLIEDGWLVPPTIYLFDFQHERKNRKGVRYPKIYNEEVTNNLKRNQLVVDIAMKAVKAGKSTLILINYIEHGENLLALLEKVYPEIEFIHGSTEAEKRQRVLQEFKEGTRKLILSSNILGEGVDIPKLEVLITARAEASTIAAYQALGRTLRPSEGKTHAIIIDLFDSECKYLESHASARLKIYASEPRYTIVPVSDLNGVNFNV